MGKGSRRAVRILKVVQIFAFCALMNITRSIGSIILLTVFGIAAYAQGLLEGGDANG